MLQALNILLSPPLPGFLLALLPFLLLLPLRLSLRVLFLLFLPASFFFPSFSPLPSFLLMQPCLVCQVTSADCIS